MKSAKKFNLYIFLAVIGISLFIVSMTSFIVNACTIQNIVLAWVLFAFIILGSGISVIGMILYIFQNKDKIKEYIDNLTK